MSIYNLNTLEGTLPFVKEELLQKYPDVNILKEEMDYISFSSDIQDIEEFHNLYSPTYIQSDIKRINLSKRDWRKEYIPAGIDPSLAYVMCMIADLKDDDIVYDPFCGTSVLPITALKYFNVKRVLCSDISGNAIIKSKVNFKAAHISEGRYKILRNDVNEIKFRKQNVDVILSNLPFGIRVGNHESNVSAYEGLERLARIVLRKRGKLVLLTQEKVLLRDVFKKDYWNVKSITKVNEGGLYPEVFEIQRLSTNTSTKQE